MDSWPNCKGVKLGPEFEPYEHVNFFDILLIKIPISFKF